MRRALLLLLPLVAACSGDTAPEAPDMRLLVLGNDMGPLVQNITLARGTAPVVGAQVTVNGIAMVEIGAGQYAGQLPTFLPEGSPVQIMVVSGGDTVIGTATVPTAPHLLVPANGDTVFFPTPLGFAWTDSSDPDEFRAAIQYVAGAEIFRFPGLARSGVVVSSRLPHPVSNLSAYLNAYNDGTFTGPARPDSKMHVRQAGGTANLILLQ